MAVRGQAWARRSRRSVAALVAAAAIAALFTPTAVAHETSGDEHGEMSIRELQRAGFGDCNAFQVVVTGLPVDHGGDVTVFREVEDGEDEVVHGPEFWIAEEEEDDGTFTFESRIFRFEQPGPLFATLSFFDEGDEHVIVGEPFTTTCGPEAGAPPTPDEECRDDAELIASANDDGSVTLEWDDLAPEDDHELYRIQRGIVGENLQSDFRVRGDTTFTDTTTEPGVTYRYEVSLLTGEGPEAPMCVEVTAIPFFGAPILVALGAVGAVGAYAFMRRRE